MLACSLVHEGVQSQSLSRIQIMQNAFEAYPRDVAVEQCRQCVEPACVEACPVDALEANPDSGNVRMVDRDECIGCGACVEACPQLDWGSGMTGLIQTPFSIVNGMPRRTGR
jgi:protein NrfC